MKALEHDVARIKVECAPASTLKGPAMKSLSRAMVVTILLLLAVLSVACSSNSLAQTQATATPLPVPTGKIGWTFDADSGQPTLANNQIYFVGYDTGILYVLDAKTGEKRWEFDPKTGSFGAWPPIVTEDTVYFLPTPSTTLIAVDLNTHQEKWRYELKFPARSPAAQGDTVYIVNLNNVVALDSATGKEKHLYFDGSWVHSPVTVDDDILYVSSSTPDSSFKYKDFVLAVNLQDEDIKWGYRVRDTVLDAPTIKDGTVYVGSWDKNLYAIDATTGNRKWRFLTPGNVNKPVVEDNVVYATSYYSRTYALTAENGKEIWSFITENSIGKPPVVVENLVFVIDNADKLYVLDGKTGQQKWAYQQKGCSPYVLDKGMIVLACEDGLKTLQ